MPYNRHEVNVKSTRKKKQPEVQNNESLQILLLIMFLSIFSMTVIIIIRHENSSL